MTKPKTGRTLSDFRQTHDKSFIVPARIKEALSQLGASWMYEHEFTKLAGLSQTDFGRYKDDYIDDHCVEVRASGGNVKRIWCGTKAFRDQLEGLNDG